MTKLATQLVDPGNADIDTWFDILSTQLLNHTHFMINGRPHRLQEIEYYYHGGAHLDPFAHGSDIQKTNNRWYFHRDNEGYRGGSFKGLDISFGPDGHFGGILIRTIQDLESGDQINGCSLCVDHILAHTGIDRVADLDADINERSVWDTSSPLHLVQTDALSTLPILTTARVGLTLKRMNQHKTMPSFIMKNYRYLTDPTIKKGKVHTLIALHKAGHDIESMHKATRSPRKSIQRYREAFEEGLDLENFNRFNGKALKVADLCVLHGAYHAHFESP